MIIKFFKSLMARKKRNEKFKKDFLKKTGVDLNQIDPGGNAKPRIYSETFITVPLLILSGLLTAENSKSYWSP